MSEQAMRSLPTTHHGERGNMLGSDGARVSLRLDKPCLAGDQSAPSNSAIAGTSMVAKDLVPLNGETLEQQIFEGQRIHCRKARVDPAGSLSSIASLECGTHRLRLAAPAMSNWSAFGPNHKNGGNQEQGQNGD
jgi:hypothetical protein